MKIFDNDVILFDGDSITDALRDRNDEYSLAGYSQVVYGQISTKLPNVKCYNRGIGGDISAQLNNRILSELNEIRPTVFSLLIGINDTWRKFDSGITITAEEYGKNVDEILTKAKRFTDRIIVIEPFLLDVDQEAFPRRPVPQDLHSARGGPWLQCRIRPDGRHICRTMLPQCARQIFLRRGTSYCVGA